MEDKAEKGEICELQLSRATEIMEMLLIDVESDTSARPGKEDAHCSRNVLRKQRHWERQQAAKKRQGKKQRKKLHRQQNLGVSRDQPQFTKRVMTAVTKERLAEAQTTGLKLCTDLSMTDNMCDKEISRLAGLLDLRRVYGSKKKANRPFHLFLTDLREDRRLFGECIRMKEGFLNYAKLLNTSHQVLNTVMNLVQSEHSKTPSCVWI